MAALSRVYPFFGILFTQTAAVKQNSRVLFFGAKNFLTVSITGKADRSALGKALEDGTPENRYLLDRRTGRILALSSKTMKTEELLAYQEKMKREPDRYEAIPRTPSEEKYRDMELFVAQAKDRKLQERLLAILRGGNPGRPFLDAVDAHPAAKEMWRTFKTQRVQKRVDDFLKENGLL